ncbi:MAG: LuxR C-terminal-related transcriptional regulator [Chloroflexi bacterium]|nr:LuxR C-terminal-related transcriptional regulator [Chloroflexota bacterium]
MKQIGFKRLPCVRLFSGRLRKRIPYAGSLGVHNIVHRKKIRFYVEITQIQVYSPAFFNAGAANGRKMEEQKGLTNREKEVMNLVVQGKLNTEVSDLLGISQSTVEKHLTSIYAKLGVRNRTEATLRYRSDSSRNP